MTWRDLVQPAPRAIVAPWLGGRSLRLGPRAWTIGGQLPPEHGWYAFEERGRSAWWKPTDDPQAVVRRADTLIEVVRGIPIGDRFVPDGARIPSDEADLLAQCEPVHLLEEWIDPFHAIYVGRPYEGGPLIFDSPALPDLAAPAVLRAWEDRRRSLDDVQHVTPALDLGFRLLWRQRDEADRRREALARAERERSEVAAQETRRRQLAERQGDAQGRRELAAVDFEAAVRAALAVGGAEYLSHRLANRQGEQVVRFRLAGRRFECVCTTSLAVIDSGVCLRDESTGYAADRELSIESLPGVLTEAMRIGRLHVFRHVD